MDIGWRECVGGRERCGNVVVEVVSGMSKGVRCECGRV